jgi:hypothetical protein
MPRLGPLPRVQIVVLASLQAAVAWAEPMAQASPRVLPTPAVSPTTAQPATPAASAVPAQDRPAEAPSAEVAPAAPDGASLAAYHAALAEKRLDAQGPFGTEQLAQLIEVAEADLRSGRRDQAIAVLAAAVESARFAPLARLDEGRAAVYLLGDALGRAGANELARVYLQRLLDAPQVDSWYRRAVATLVDLGLGSGDPAPYVAALSRVPATGTAWAGDVAYLRGILHERAAAPREALAAYASVPQNSRFWAQATYRAGLLEVDQGRLGEGERWFCRIADPKQTPKLAPLFGGNDFFHVRDLSRLALGRVAHEQYRFDDARYYYHLVPGDSERLPEALYESATSRYESKDYAGAHALLGELAALGRHHAYEDEAYILDAYVDLGRCQFPSADRKLSEFLQRYEPVLNLARHLQTDRYALRALLAGQDAAAVSEGWSRDVAEMIRTSVRVDAAYAVLTRQLADLDHQLSGLGAARAEIQNLASALAGSQVVARQSAPLADGPGDRLVRLEEQAAAARRLLREAAQDTPALVAELAAMRGELNALTASAEGLRSRLDPIDLDALPEEGQGLTELLARDGKLALSLARDAEAVRTELALRRDALASEALARLERRLARLVRRARAGRIETVLGRKRALELEVEALSQGFLPQGAVDSLDAARYLADDEEYWPFDGEDWEDEYIGGEGLR